MMNKNRTFCFLICIMLLVFQAGCGVMGGNASENGADDEIVTADVEAGVFDNGDDTALSEPEPVITEEEKRTSWVPKVEIGNVKEDGSVYINQKAFDLIDAIISEDVENGFPGAQVAVIMDNHLLFTGAWGTTNAYNPDGTLKDDSAPVTDETLYDLASNTKMYAINYAVQYLVTHDGFDINTKIVDIIGEQFADDTIEVHYKGYEFPGLDTQKEWKSNLTVRDVLCHEAGFPADPRYHNAYFDQSTRRREKTPVNLLFAGSDADDVTRENTFEMICKTPLMYEPGTETIYSDVDYMLMAFVIESVTGTDLQTYLKNVFWEPMGLDHITFNPLENGFTKDDCAATELNGNTRDGVAWFDNIRTYTLQGEVHDEKAWYCMDGVSGHAGLFSSATDLALLANLMLNGGESEDDAFFSQAVIDEFTAAKDEEHQRWGIGWWRQGRDYERTYYFGDLASPETFGHQGWTGTLTCIDPTRNLVIVLLTNKINTPVSDPQSNADYFKGSDYTTASLSFVPQIIMTALNGDDEALDSWQRDG